MRPTLHRPPGQGNADGPAACVRPADPSDDRGSAAVEITLIAPLLLLLLLLAVAMGRTVSARIDVDGAAQQAARAASLTRDGTSARQAAQQAATTVLAGEGRACTRIAVDTDTSAFRPGGLAQVTVTCTTTLSDLGVPLPGSHDSTGHAAVPIDTYIGAAP